MKLRHAAWLISGLAVTPVSAQAEDSTIPQSICFTVVEGRPGVLPGAPMLVDRCTGETFVLTRSRSAIAWVPITKASADRPDAKAVAKAPTGKKGCFTYGDRTYCP